MQGKSLAERYHIEDISPVPPGTDIIENPLLSGGQKRLFSCERATKSSVSWGKKD